MRASFDIRNNYFIIIAADEQLNAASGCSIDDSVRVLRTLGAELSIDFFNRNNVPFIQDGKVVLHNLSAVKKSLQEKSLSGDVQIVNTLDCDKGRPFTKMDFAAVIFLAWPLFTPGECIALNEIFVA